MKGNSKGLSPRFINLLGLFSFLVLAVFECAFCPTGIAEDDLATRYIALAWASEELQDDSQAEKYWNMAGPDYIKGKSWYHERIGRNDLAENDWTQRINRRAACEDLIQRGHFYERVNRLNDALRDYNAAIGAHGTDTPFNYLGLDARGCYYGRQGMWQQATNDLLKSYNYKLSISKGNNPVFTGVFTVAAAYEMQGKHQKAMQLIGDSSAENLKRLEEAKKAFEPATQGTTRIHLNESDKDFLGTWTQLGKYYKDRGDTPRAQICYEHVLKLSPDNAIAKSYLADLGVIAESPVAKPTATPPKKEESSLPRLSTGQPSTASNLAAPPGEKVNRHTDGPIRDKWALIVGISHFKNPQYDLKVAAKDAQDFYNYLVNEANFRRDHVLLLLDGKATRQQIMSAFGDHFLPAVCEPGDLVVVYVSTHGTPKTKDKGGRNYIAAYDTDANDLYATGVDMDELNKRLLEGVKTDRALIIMDTCYSGAGIPGARALNVADNFSANELAQGCGHLVISSSSPNEKAYESRVSNNGVFTKYLIEALRKNNKVDVKTAFAEVEKQVSWEVKSVFGEKQTPQLGGNWDGQQLILSVPASESRPMLNPDLLKMMQPTGTPPLSNSAQKR